MEKQKQESKADLQLYEGHCHCNAVRFEVYAPKDLTVFRCNCSICTMKQNHHFIVPKENFKLLSGGDNLTTYTFGTHTAKHTFCKTCGIHSFYTPRSNPDGFAITIYCINREKAKSITYVDFDGKNWEQSYEKTGVAEFTANPLYKK